MSSIEPTKQIIQIKVNQTYNLDDYELICLVDCHSQMGGRLRRLWMSKIGIARDPMKPPDISVDFDLMSGTERDYIIQTVKAYLDQHPEKIVKFDGCCFHYPSKPKETK